MANYGSTTGVQALLPSVGTFSGSSIVSETELTAWLEQGASAINTAIVNAGYQTPAPIASTVYDQLTALNNLYAAAQVMRALGIDTTTGEDDSRSDRWMREFWGTLKRLGASDLTSLGLTPLAVGRRRRIRTLQTRRIDGYSDRYSGEYSQIGCLDQ